MAKFKFGVVLADGDYTTARVADGAAADLLTDKDVGKFVKLIGDSQYGMCAVGNEIEGVLYTGPDQALTDGYNIATVNREGRVRVTLDGLQATPGVGVIAIGDYVVAGTVVARGTALSAPPKVCKATAAGAALIFKWRVVSLDGTTAVGQTGLIEFVG